MIATALTPGEVLKLRRDALPNLKIREWIVLGKNNGRIILIKYKQKGHTVEVVRDDDIDWEEYLRGKDR